MKSGKYKTQAGLDAVVLCDDAPGPFPLVGYVVGCGGASVMPMSWRADGRCGDELHEGVNLIPDLVYLNLYADDRGVASIVGVHRSIEGAEDQRRQECLFTIGYAEGCEPEVVWRAK